MSEITQKDWDSAKPITVNWLAKADKIGQEEGIPSGRFLEVVRQESNGNPSAKSPKGAIGLSQLMPNTAKELGVNPYNPEDNLRGGARYLKQMYDRFGDWGLAHAAYNAGPEAVRKHGGIPPYQETRKYVSDIQSRITPDKSSVAQEDWDNATPISEEDWNNAKPVDTTTPKTIEQPKGVVDRLITGAGKNVSDIAKGVWDIGGAVSDVMVGKPEGFKKVYEYGKGALEGVSNLLTGAEAEGRKLLGVSPREGLSEEKIMAGEQAIQPFKHPIEYTIDNPVKAALAVVPGLQTARTAVTASRMSNVANVAKVMDKVIDTGIAKGVRPLGQAGRRTISGVERYQTAGREVVKDIVANKDSNILTNAKGDIATNKVPHSIAQTVDAVDQGLTRTARTYLDAVERVTGQKVITPVQKVIDDLKIFVDDPVNQMANPTAVKYAKIRIKNFEIRDAKGNVTGVKELDPSQLETLLQSQTSLRKQLINNPTKDIDRLHVEGIVNKSLREIQDGLMSKFDGPEYRTFKNKYAAYKQLEGDVIQRNKVVSRQGPYSLIDFSDVYTLPKIMGDVARGDFIGAGKGALMKIIAKHHKWANKPDTAIKNMFTGVDELASKYPGSLP